MQPLRIYSVVSKLPPKLEAMWDLAYNLFFSWNDRILNLFASIDHELWRRCQENPVAFLNNIPQKTLEELSRDDFFLSRLEDAKKALDQYMSRKPTAFTFPENKNHAPVVAYFSLEYGITLSLPIYSGGLGILAGDHLKSASDLNIPLVGMGLLYREGYFRQYMTPDGWQQERYPENDFNQMPVHPVRTKDGEPVSIIVDLAGQPLTARIWEARVGRIRLFLLDTYVPENPEHFRQITSSLYGGNLEMRLWQEILLGIGGVKALTALGLEPKVIHMNEGHSAFAGLERIRVFMQEKNLPFEAAGELAASSSVFTTHTPVPAGNDRFPPDLMRPYFEGYVRSLGLAYKVFLALGREDPRDDNEPFCMTVLALKLSRFNNGVSKLHGKVSRNMWKKVWPQYPEEDVPIGAITNGVHMPTWVAKDMALLFDRYLGVNWREDPDCARFWANAENIPDAELWRTHERLRERLVDFVRKRLRKQLLAKGARRKELQMAEEVLDPQALTIGFARRFATYKRAHLLLQDKERLLRLIQDAKRPLQFIFAGKAHPQDNEGKKIIQELIQFCRREECRYNMVFLEDYDIKIASRMVQGCDVWLNNPRRPLEACGTSGMKAMANGVMQCSTLDGWWDEAYRPDNRLGWAIGAGEEYDDLAYQDFVESQTLYNLLENEIIPEFYDRGHGNLPRSWIRGMKEALKELGPVFNAHRMVEDYVEKAYLPAYTNFLNLMRDSFAPAKALASWRMEMMTKWGTLNARNVRVETPGQIYVREPVIVECEVYLGGGLRPEDILVQIYHGPVGQDDRFSSRQTTPMSPEAALSDGWHLFRGDLIPSEAGRFGFTVRILPHHPLLLDPHSLGLIFWAKS
ncbi:alpha-glucan family phosphorylase [Desulfovibrio aminophilus]|uniref:alpha-glucan family phosphorylase n=1 Tax=Desulfovibrio aminophilus TaxID=81425 RepID=UPI0033951007